MNRAKKEEQKKLDAMTSEERAEHEKNERINELARRLHLKLFPEEYDFMYDDALDTYDRQNGINPMNAEYVKEVNQRRAKMGVSPLDESGGATDNKSREFCRKKAEVMYDAGDEDI